MAHNVRRSVEENDGIAVKYEAERERLGVTDACRVALLHGRDVSGGQTAGVSRTGAQQLARRHGVRRAWIVTGSGLLSPIGRRFPGQRAVAAVDDVWCFETKQWLEPLWVRENANDPSAIDAVDAAAVDEGTTQRA
jgi:hypothetical protein